MTETMDEPLATGRATRDLEGDRTEAHERRPLLLFFTEATSGPCRRMQSLVAWLKVTRKKSLRVAEVDVGNQPTLVASLGVSRTPTLVLVDGGRPVARLEGRATGKQIDELLRPYLR